MQNNLARIVCKSPYNTNVTKLLRELYWLPVRHRITYKVVTITIAFACSEIAASNLVTYWTRSSYISLLEHYAHQVLIY